MRHCWTGHFLTADAQGGVRWQLMNPSQDDYQQWGVTSDGFLVSRATAQVLQVGDDLVLDGAPCKLGSQAALGTDVAYRQQFDFNRVDGSVRARLTGMYGITYDLGNNGGIASVLPTATSVPHKTLLIEFISPLQFFSLLNGSTNADRQQWLTRNGNSVTLEFSQTSAINQLFTVSRYGEVVSPLDGFVLQSLGPERVPAFVDPAPDPIGFDSTTFQYNFPEPVVPGGSGLGVIALRSNPLLGLIARAQAGQGQPIMYSPMGLPLDLNRMWKLVGPPGSIFSAHTDLARQFFANPAPLPGASAAAAVSDTATRALVAELDKATRVIIAIVVGVLDIVAGISVGTVSNKLAAFVAQRVLGNATIAARISVMLGGACTVASVIGVAEAITKARIWYELFDLLLPNSFWGWTITILKMGVTIASYAVGVGVAITGAKIALVVAEILNIVRSDPAAAKREAALLAAHARHLRAAAP